MKSRLTQLLLLGLLLALHGNLLPAQDAKVKADPFTGTWRLDPSKTEDSNPTQFIIDPIRNGISIRQNDAKPVLYEYGKDVPNPDGNTYNFTRINAHTLTATVKGRTTAKETTTISADGRHNTRVRETTTTSGVVKSTGVYDRVGAAPSGDAFLGTWRQDPSKSKNEPPQERTYKIDGDVLDFSVNGRHMVTAKFDGKEYKMANGSIVTLKRIDAQTIEMVLKSPAGPPTTTQMQVKGNTLISSVTGTGAQGKPRKQVFDEAGKLACGNVIRSRSSHDLLN